MLDRFHNIEGTDVDENVAGQWRDTKGCVRSTCIALVERSSLKDSNVHMTVEIDEH
jgi:hypothetical protein